MGKLIIFFLILLFGFSSPAQAYNEGFRYNNGVFLYIGVGSNPNYYTRTKCKIIPAHWYRGYWYPAREVCYQTSYRNNVRCGWVPGYWRHGVWYPKHQICWR
jgi:hypothetical protein